MDMSLVIRSFKKPCPIFGDHHLIFYFSRTGDFATPYPSCAAQEDREQLYQ